MNTNDNDKKKNEQRRAEYKLVWQLGAMANQHPAMPLNCDLKKKENKKRQTPY